MAALFGETVVEMGFITAEQLNEVIELQKKGRAKLGQVMKNQRLLADEQVERTLNYQLEEKGLGKMFGDCAVELGFITENQVMEALRYQKTSKGVLGEQLIDLGYITVNQRDQVIKAQFTN